MDVWTKFDRYSKNDVEESTEDDIDEEYLEDDQDDISDEIGNSDEEIWYQEFENKNLDDIIDYVDSCRKLMEIDKIVIERNFVDSYYIENKPDKFNLRLR